MNIHKSCVKIVEETCIGTIRNKKDKRRDRMSGIMENIIGKNRKPSQSTPGSIERTKKSNEDWSIHSETGFSYLYGSSGESQIDGGERTAVSFRCEPSRDRIESESEDCQAFHTDNTSSTMDDPNLVKKGNSIGRSESFRQQRENRVPIRKRSDPNIPRSKSDAEVDEKNTSDLNNSGSSSNSSLSTRSLDSPSISVEMVHKTPGGTPTDSASSSVPSTGPSPSTVPPSSSSSNFHQLDDSDLDAENDPPKWQENVNINVIRLMKPKEKKRQDVINELFHTERTHVRNLKVLDKLFFKPIQQEQLLTQDHLYLLFPNLEEMLKIHSNFNNIMKVCRREQQVVGDVGSIMLEMLDGHSGDRLKSEAATFCRNQSTALELLKNKQKKEQKLAQFLSDAEANQLCRRLQLKDIIATGFQRLTKYPLLLENIAKYTPQNSEEHSRLLRAVHCSKQILAYVNQAVKEAENEHRLSELQKKMDRSAFEKVEAPIVQNYRHLDLTKHRLIHEGPLIWRLHKQKTIEMHVVLFEDILVLLQKQDDKLLLKFHSNNLMSGREDTKITHSPILRVQNLFTRNVATDSKGFFLVSTSEQHAIYEFVASSASERKMWLKHITEAAEAHKPRHSQSAKCQDSSPTLPERQDNTQGNNLAKNKMMPNIITDDSIKIRKYSLDQDHPEVINNAESTETRESSSTVSLTAHPTPDTEVSSPNSSSTYLPEEDSSSLSPQKEAPSPCSSVEDHQQSLQGVELIHVPSEPQLIEPSEIKVSESTVLQTAVPLLTPIEMVRRKDKQIAEALAEKQDLVSKILQIPREEFEHVTETANEYEVATDVKQLVLASIHQANQLAGIVNEGLRVYEDDRISNTEVVADEDNGVYSETPSLIDPKKAGRLPGFPPLEKLLDISCKLNRQLTQILSHVTDKEEERIQLQLELHTSREQLHFLHETHRLCCGMISRSPSNLSVNQSRANSFISSTSDPVDENEDKTDILTGEKFKEVENDEISEEEKQNSFVGDEEINKVEQVQPEEEDENTDINFVYMTEEEKFKNQSTSTDTRPYQR
ncbi:rho guanine nucleotide exchange factor 11-like isoform X1 [Limulus polyphemus]|uniref:Rho guanine nucleotide exchange factor 11-like isoform X1 n=1 Tax=Limulus polyphemus TaxID=6850 RepID=A0ABM1T0J2_LIMPO|nr:rho guanine nucleotide exchange factor 11-like isoform X1 [Limulus polyphemus]